MNLLPIYATDLSSLMIIKFRLKDRWLVNPFTDKYNTWNLMVELHNISKTLSIEILLDLIQFLFQNLYFLTFTKT